MEKRIKTGGRSKGTPNRTTAETKELLQSIVSKELDKLGAMLEQLEPNERINAIAKLLPYILPKQSEIIFDNPEPLEGIFIKVIDSKENVIDEK